MKKLTFSLLFLSLLFLKVKTINAGVVNYPVETNILLTSPNIILVVQIGSAADSIVVDDSTITVTVSSPDSFSIRSDNRYNLSNNGGLGINCGSSNSILTIQPTSGQQTVVITPTTQTCTSPSNSSSSIISQSSNSSSGCGDSVTASIPDLFEIRTTKNSAQLFFTPPSSNFSKFYVSYGRQINALEYGVEFNQSPTGGVLNYTIYALQPNTKYYFKIRPGNGCATGNWGNTMNANTAVGNSKKVTYKNLVTKAIHQIKSTINNLIPSKKVSIEQTVQNNGSVHELNNVIQIQEKKTIQNQVVSKNKFCILWWCF